MIILYSVQTFDMWNFVRDCGYDYEETTVLGVFNKKEDIFHYLREHITPTIRLPTNHATKVQFNNEKFFIKHVDINCADTNIDNLEEITGY